jgi:hypothetical protein
MRRRIRTIALIVVGVAVLMATIHFTINGFPALSSLNPHAH